ncbi:MAG: M20/M25/M40 family metallo-hydrolase [Anaerolineales bacterium]|nr:M20/M25/M40 family metallo-hydrolase [Anaerolineales bacterium]MCB9127812.1 M20/M25/M40 family metallo-hydrolase [Ardenticatenales bacterium]
MSDAALRFLQRLIQTPSLPGEEGPIAELILNEMGQLGYDEAYRDVAGNVIGIVRGRGEAPAVMFNTHLDHVDPGPASAWPDWASPYSGAIHEGAVWGRGASDIKGPLVAQLYGVAALIGDGPPAGDIYVTMDVQEETGGLGARVLAPTLAEHVPLALIGEPSNNELRRGHRGRVELVARITGRSVHASMPELGVNPLYVLAGFLQRIGRMPMATHSELGRSTLAPTLLTTDQRSANVTPGQVELTLDWRTIPNESADQCQQRLQRALDDLLIGEVRGEVLLADQRHVSYSGYELDCACTFPAFSVARTDPAVVAAEALLSEATGTPMPATYWRFATDGGHFAQAGMTVIGFGPGDERVVHTVHEHINIAQWEEAIRLNGLLAREWPSRVAELRAASSPS